MTNWPWPLTGVQNWFENLWNHVTNAAYNAVSVVSDWIWNAIYWVRNRLKESIEWVYDQLEPMISGVRITLGNVWTAISTTVTSTLKSLGTALTNARDWIVNSIISWFTKVKDWINSGIGWVWSRVQTGLNSLLSAVSSSLTSFRNSLGKAFNSGISWLWDQVTSGINGAVSTIGNAINSFVEQTQTWVTDAIAGGMDWVTNALAGVATALGDALSGFFDWMLKHLTYFGEMVLGAVQILIDRLTGVVEPIIVQFMNMITGTFVPGSPSPEMSQAANTLANVMWARQIEIVDEGHSSPGTYEELFPVALKVMASSMAAGGTGMAAATAADQANPAKNPGFRPTMRELIYWAGIPSVTASIATLPTAIGLLEPMRYFLNERWLPHWPSAQDAIRFAVREVFLEERREALIAYYPGEKYTEMLAKQGFRPEFAEYYWMAHWVLPSISQLNEMLYRGIITRETWMTYVRYNDYIPEMIEPLEKIIYEPYTRVDIRRMWDVRLVTEEEVYENYRWLGYDDEHAKKMTLWTKVYTAIPDLTAQYRKGWITSADMYMALIELGVPEARADEMMRTLIPAEKPERTEKERDLTKTDILRLLKIREISEAQAQEMLIDLGYDEGEAGYLIALYTYQEEIELRELTMSQIMKAYRYEIYDRPEAKNKLVEAGWSEESAETLLRLEDVKRLDAHTERARDRDLSRTDIIKAINQEIIDVETGYNYLGYLGYSDWEIRVIFALEGIG